MARYSYTVYAWEGEAAQRQHAHHYATTKFDAYQFRNAFEAAGFVVTIQQRDHSWMRERIVYPALGGWRQD